MNDQLRCWQCRQLLAGVIFPMSRREECDACGADQHVCKLCLHYQPGISNDCNEDRAEAVTDKERANFCDYFQPGVLPAGSQSGGDPLSARQALAELFGDEPPDSPLASDNKPSPTEADKALDALNELFNKD